MTVSGAWNITIKSPIGEQKAVLNLSEDGGSLSGTLAGSGEETAISDGKVSGDSVSWSAAVTKPMPVKLEFAGTVAGEALSGNVKLGMFGSAPFSGARA